MRQFTLALLIAVAPFAAHAQQDGTELRNVPIGTLLNNIALDAAAGTRTFTVAEATLNKAGRGYSTLGLTFVHTNNTSTDIGWTCTCAGTKGGTEGTLQSCTVSSGVCTLNDASWTKTVSGNKNFYVPMTITGCRPITCVVTSTGASSTDKLTLTGVLVAQ